VVFICTVHTNLFSIIYAASSYMCCHISHPIRGAGGKCAHTGFCYRAFLSFSLSFFFFFVDVWMDPNLMLIWLTLFYLTVLWILNFDLFLGQRYVRRFAGDVREQRYSSQAASWSEGKQGTPQQPVLLVRMISTLTVVNAFLLYSIYSGSLST
jgi:hypothetical protein